MPMVCDSARPFGLGQGHPVAIVVGLGQGDSASPVGLGQSDPEAILVGLGQGDSAMLFGFGYGDSAKVFSDSAMVIRPKYFRIRPC